MRGSGAAPACEAAGAGQPTQPNPRKREQAVNWHTMLTRKFDVVQQRRRVGAPREAGAPHLHRQLRRRGGRQQR